MSLVIDIWEECRLRKRSAQGEGEGDRGERRGVGGNRKQRDRTTGQKDTKNTNTDGQTDRQRLID